MKNKTNVKQAGVFYLFGTLFNNGIAFLTVPIFTRILTVTDYGIVTTYNSWVAILSMFLSLALYMGVRISFVDFEEKANDFLSTILLFTLVYGCSLSAIICVVVYLVPISISLSLVVLCLLQALGSALIEDVSQFLLMKFNYKLRTAIMILPNLVSTIVAIILIRYVLSSDLYWGRIFPTAIITFIFGIILFLSFVPKGKVSINKEYLKYALKISLPLVLHGIALNILSQSDRTMITLLKDSSETGIYGLVYNFSMIATVITSAFDGIWVPFFMDKMKRNQISLINNYSSKYIELMSVAMTGVVLLGPEIVKLLAAKPYWQGIVIIPPIVLSNYLIFIYTLYAYVEHYYKKTGFISVNTLIAAVTNIILNYFFIIKWGYIGAAYSTLISYGVSLILHYLYSRKLNKEVIPTRTVILHLSIMIVIVIVFYIFVNQWFVRWSIAFMFALFMMFKEKRFIISNIFKR